MAEAGDGKDRSNKRRRHHLLQKRVDDHELALFIERAHDAGFSNHQEYLGALINGDADFDRRERHDLVKILGELGKHGSNLNQISHGINSGRVTNLSPDDMKMIEEARKAVSDVAQELRGVLE